MGNYEFAIMNVVSVSHLLEGYFVEAGIDVARCACLSFAVWHDESHFGYAFVGGVLASDAYVGEWDEPSAGHACAAVCCIHGASAIDFGVEVGGVCFPVV